MLPRKGKTSIAVKNMAVNPRKMMIDPFYSLFESRPMLEESYRCRNLADPQCWHRVVWFFIAWLSSVRSISSGLES